MPFEPGNQLWRTRKTFTHSGGRPTLEQAKAKETFYQALVRLRDEQGLELATNFFKRARKSDNLMKQVVASVLPAAPQKVDIGINISRQSVVAILANDEGKQAALAVTKLLAERSKTIVTTSENE